ncbi:MAG: S-methyl-5'-thioadenosine phosphorylase [Polyangiales bacterium]
MSETAANYKLGVLGGSGLYELEGLRDVREEPIETPFGHPSDPIVRGWLGDTELLFVPRHGRGHRVAPSAVNYRANVAALKMAGATHLLAVSAVGSMKEEIAPGDLVVVDQFIDLTRRRCTTFFSQAPARSEESREASLEHSVPVAHVSFADPVCEHLAAAVAEAASTTSAKVHRGGTYVCIEGPQFSTKAESRLYRSWGVDVIGMTNATEAKLAREAELPFATLALATDYDCWYSGHDAVTVEQVVATLHANVRNAKAAIVALASRLPDPTKSKAHGALKGAIMTDPARIPEQIRARFAAMHLAI